MFSYHLVHGSLDIVLVQRRLGLLYRPRGKGMKESNTKAEIKAFRERWKRLNRMEIEELRRTPPETKLKQFFTLMGWARYFGWEPGLARGEDEVRRRWNRLRQTHGIKKAH